MARLTRTVWLTGLLACTACGDPSLRILVDMPEEYLDDVDRVSVQILRPPGSDPFGCEELAFQDVDPETVRLSLVTEQLIDPPDDGHFPGIDRLADKLIRLRALDVHGLPVLMACAEVGEVTGDHLVELTAEPAALVSLGELDEVLELTRLDETLRDIIEVLVTDVRNRPMANTAVRWKLLGPGGATSDGEGTTNASGKLDFHRTAADDFLPGPYLIEVQVRWARRTPPVLKGYNTPTPELHLAEGFFIDAHAGRIGPQGQPGYAFLMQQCPAAQSCVAYRVFGGEQGQIDLPDEMSIKKMGVLGTADRDHVVFLASDAGPEPGSLSWFTLDIQGRALIPGEAVERPVEDAQFPDRIHLQPGGTCLPGAGRSDVLVPTGMVTVDVYTLGAGGRVMTRPDSPFWELPGVDRVVASGCVSDQTGEVHRTVLCTSVTDELFVAYDAEGLGRFDWPVIPEVTGFVRGQAPESALMLTAHLGSDNPGVARRMHTLAGSGVESRLEVVSWDPLLALPRLLGGGDVDGDGLGDVVAILYPESGLSAPPGIDTLVAQQTILGVQHRGKRLSGSARVVRQHSDWSPDPRAVELIDVDGNGADDILLFIQAYEPPPLGSHTVVVEMHPMGH